MVNSYEPCCSAISIFLLILSILEIITTVVPLICLSDALRFTGTHVAAVCGLVAGLVTLPASIRLKFNESSPDLERLHGHTSFFKKLTLFVSLILNIVAAFVTVVTLLRKKNFVQDFGRIMKFYHRNTPVRILVNMIQLNLDCCGALSYKDWLSINWRMFEVSNDDDVVEEESTDAVPFSCCNRYSNMACGHHDLQAYGTSTIHRVGCGKHLKCHTRAYLWELFTLYFITVALETLLLVIYYSDSSHGNRRMSYSGGGLVTGYARVQGSPWDVLSDCSKSSEGSSKSSDMLESSKESLVSDIINLYEGSLGEETAELTSSHKQVRIVSPLGDSTRSIRMIPDFEQ